MERIEQGVQRRWLRQIALPVGFYLVATLILTYPLIAQLETHAAGAPYGDQFEAVRLIWWSKVAILRGLHPAYQPLLVYPDGFFSTVQWGAPLAHLVGVPFALFLSPLAAYNLTFLTAHLFTALAAYVLGKELTGRQSAALLGGLIFMAFPTRMGHATAGHLGLMTNYWLLLYAWSLVRLWRGAGWKTAALGGLFFTLTAATYPTNLTYQLIPLTIVFGSAMIWRHRARWRSWLRPALIMAGVAVMGVLFFYLPMLVGYLNGDIRYLQETGVVRYSADLLAFVTPSPFNPTLSGLGLIPGWAGDVLGDSTVEGSAYLGIVGIALAGLALWKCRLEARSWLLVGLVGAILALGPVLKVGDQVLRIPLDNGDTAAITMPYALYGALPGVGMSRTPARLNMLTALAVSALAAYGFAALVEWRPRLNRPAWKAVALVGLSAFVMVEYAVFPSFPTTDAPLPAYFQTLADDAARGDVRPVLDLPAGDFFVGQWQLYYQTAHQQPLLTGHEIRKTRANPAMLALLNRAAQPPVEGEIVPAISTEQAAGLFRASGAEVVILHRRFGYGQQAESIARLNRILGAPVYEDADVMIFEVPDGPPLEEIVYAANELWVGGEAVDGYWFNREIAMSFYMPEAQEGFWQFGASSWLLDRWLYLDLDDQVTDSFFLAAVEGPRQLESSIYTQVSGFHQIRFWVEDNGQDCALLPGDPACRRVAIMTPNFVFEDETQTPRVDFGDTMRLIRYEVEEAGEGQFHLEFLWQTLGPARPDYTLFIHLLDEDGDNGAQWDGPLGGEAMPTSQWPVNGFVYQDVVFSYPADLEAGTYELYAGLYTYPDITRLPVHSDLPRAQDGLLYLQDVVIPPQQGE